MEIKRGRYKTRGGNDAVVLAVDLPVDYNRIVGYVTRHGHGYKYASACAWEQDGRIFTTFDGEDDLVEYLGE